MIFGDTVVGYARRLAEGIVVDDEALQLVDIEAVGPGGSYLGRAYTRAHHRDLWRTPWFDTATHEHWVEAGIQTLADRLRAAATELTARRERILDEAVEARLDALWA